MRNVSAIACITAALVAEILGAYAGHWNAYRKIQATCDDPAAQTQINGRTYMCVTKEQWNEVAERIFQMGFATGAKSARSET